MICYSAAAAGAAYPAGIFFAAIMLMIYILQLVQWKKTGKNDKVNPGHIRRFQKEQK